MKANKNLHNAVLAGLFIVGTLAVICAFGEPSETMNTTEWLCCFYSSSLVGCGCFYLLGKLSKKWGRK